MTESPRISPLSWLKSLKISLSAAPFYASLLVILALAIFIGIFWAINEYQAHQESIENIRNTYEQQYRDRVKEELDTVVSFIDFTRNQANIIAEDEIRNRVQSAYTIASHLYNMHKNEKSVDEIRKMVVEVLRPVRWFGERGYYFAGRTENGVIDLFADEPYFEGKLMPRLTITADKTVIKDIIRIVKDKGAGIYRYNLTKPAYQGQVFSKICFVKYFAPFDWFLGAGIYNNDMESMNQAAALARISQMRFGQGGEVFVFRSDGTIISHQNEFLIGRSVRSLSDSNAMAYGEQLWQAGAAPTGEGYIIYQEAAAGQPSQQKLCFVQAYRDWNWVVAASVHMNEMETLITDATETYRRIAFKNVSTFIFLFSVAVSLLLFIAYYYTVKIKQGFSLFTDFFRRAADSKVKIEQDDLAFSEFEDLAVLANRMVDDRIEKEALLHRDELRLDTLLQLGIMDDYTLKAKYEFTLQRIIEITRSEEGYLALINKPQTHVTIISHRTADGTKVAYANKRNLSSPVIGGGLPGRAVSRRQTVICNDCSCAEQSATIYPYRGEVKRHLDVPIYTSGTITLVAGVCNNPAIYDNSDARQLTMLLEGMWLHVLKTRTEKKMGRLERQIIAVREAERSNIGRILHDDLGSHLSGVELLSKALKRTLEKENPARADQLEQIRELIVDATEKTRRLARGLYPVHIIENGLEAAIEELAMEIETLFGISCELSFSGQVEYIDNTIATHIYYIIREASFNAAKHGSPDNIGITMHTEDNFLMMKIIDNGQGFDTLTTRRRMGLHTMEYRAKAIGATLTLKSGSHMGTVVSVSRDIAN